MSYFSLEHIHFNALLSVVQFWWSANPLWHRKKKTAQLHFSQPLNLLFFFTVSTMNAHSWIYQHVEMQKRQHCDGVLLVVLLPLPCSPPSPCISWHSARCGSWWGGCLLWPARTSHSCRIVAEQAQWCAQPAGSDKDYKWLTDDTFSSFCVNQGQPFCSLK